jgi:Ca2+-binding EF-hand superfamily protein
LKSVQNNLSASADVSLSTVLGTFITESLFNSIDTDKSGSINAQEFTAFILRSTNQFKIVPPSLDAIKNKFAEMDTSRNGQVTLEEFTASFKAKVLSGNDSDASFMFNVATTAAFSRIDQNHDGVISAPEFVAAIKEFVKTHPKLGKFNEENLKTAFFSTLNKGETSFGLIQFQRLAQNLLVEVNKKTSQCLCITP